MNDDYKIDLPKLVIDKNKEESPSSEVIKGYINGSPTLVHKSCVNITETNEELVPRHQSLLYLLFDEGWRNDYINSPPPQFITSKWYERQYKDFSSISSGIPSTIPIREWEGPYAITQSGKRGRELLEKYTTVNSISGEQFPNYNIGEYTPHKISYEVRQMLNRPKLYFEQLKPLLDEPDEGIGFYKYQGLLVLCKHLYMIYDGVGPRDVFAECGDENGMCKFCGMNLPTQLTEINENMDPHQLAIVFSFIDTLPLTIDPFVPFHIIVDSIGRSLIKMELDDTNKINGYVACYVYKLNLDIEDMNIKRKAMISFSNTVKREFDKNGWTEEDVKRTIKNNDLFIDYSSVLDSIRSFVTAHNEETSPLVISLYSNPKNPLIKIYESDPSAFALMNELIRIRSHDTIGTKTKMEITLPNRAITENIIGEDSNLSYYKKWGDVVCPCGGIHKLPCSKCGLKENLSNLIEVLDKCKPKLDENQWHSLMTNSRDSTIKAIKASSSDKNHKIRKLDLMLSDTYRERIYEILIQMVGIGPIPEITSSPDNICKLINYLLPRSDVDGDWMIAQLESVFISNYTLVFTV